MAVVDRLSWQDRRRAGTSELRWVGPFDKLAGGETTFALALRREFRDDGEDDRVDKGDGLVSADERDDFVSSPIDYGA